MKSFVRILLSSVITALLFVFSSCRREPIEYPVSNYYLELDFRNIENPTTDYRDYEIYTVALYSKETGRLAWKNYLFPFYHPSGMGPGGYLSDVEPGEYRLCVYAYDTRTTTVRNDANTSSIYYDTDNYGYSNNLPVIKMPDDMLRNVQDIIIPYVTDGDPVSMLYAPVMSSCQTVKINMKGIKNFSLARSITVYLSGQCRGKWLRNPDEKLDGNSIIMVTDDLASTRASSDDVVYSVDITTFGRNPETDRCLLTVFVTAEGGIVSWDQVDVTSLLYPDAVSAQKDRLSREITVDLDLVVEERMQSGFNPEADPWETEHDIIILR